jgi:uncharacterized protein (DUF1778 family)
MAAPRKSYKDLKNCPVHVYVSDDLYGILKQAADIKGIGVSTLLRQLAIEKADEILNSKRSLTVSDMS